MIHGKKRVSEELGGGPSVFDKREQGTDVNLRKGLGGQ